jgi:hypothetical protein
MKKILFKVLAVIAVVLLAGSTQLQAQNLLKGLKDAATKAVNNATGSSSTSSSSAASAATGAVSKAVPAAKGKTYYVSVSTGSARQR